MFRHKIGGMYMDNFLCSNSSVIQYFSNELVFTNENFSNALCSEKAESKKIPTNNTLCQNLAYQNEINFRFDSFADKSKDIEIARKPNLRKLCSFIALKLGFNVSSTGTFLLIDAILYLYYNNIDVCQMKTIYTMLEKKHNLATTKVRWNIENSMKSMRKYSNEKAICSFFTEYDGRFLNAKYIIALSVYELGRHFTPPKYTNERIEKILYSI